MSTLFERASANGYWEAAALARHPGMKLAFRNYAWSGDTVRCQARAYFDLLTLRRDHHDRRNGSVRG